MQHESGKSETVKLKLQKLKFYRLTGTKYVYGLGEMAYGEWLILKEGKPFYYVNIFREEYRDIREKIKGDIEDFIKIKLKENGDDLELEHPLFGVRSSKTSEELFELQYLPRGILE